MGRCQTCCKIFTVSLVPVTVFLLALTFIIGIILLPTLYTELATKEQYAIVIDAGSTHTEMYLYVWELPFISQTGRVHQKSECLALGSGISSYIYNTSLAGISIQNCVKGLLNNIPKGFKRKNKVDVWLGATAGMRLLRNQNHTLSNEIMQSVNESLESFNTRHRQRILSGQEEGAAGWITTNYLDGKLRQKYPKKREVTSITSVGAMDMGGASMQIAFQISSASNHTYSAKLFGQEFKIYSRSYLCYGINEAMRRFFAYLVKENGVAKSTSINNPCGLRGNNITHNMSYIFTDPCTKDLAPDYNESLIISFNGTGDPESCRQHLEKALNFSKCIVNDTNDCSKTPVYERPPVSGTFLGFSNFYYTMDFFRITKLNGTSIKNYHSNVTSYCNENWKDVVYKYNRTYSTKYLSRYCFDGIFVSYVLQDGFGFNDTKNDWSISFKQRVGDIDVGWSLGYMLNRTTSLNDTPYYTNYPYSAVDLIVGMIVLTILSVVFIIFFVFTCTACRKALKPVTTGYTNIM